MQNNKSLINPIIVEEFDTCVKCGKKNSIECYDRNGMIIRYSILLNRFKKDKNLQYIDKRPIEKFKCTNCGKEFDIYWTIIDTDIRFPIPFTNKLRLDYLINKINKGAI